MLLVEVHVRFGGPCCLHLRGLRVSQANSQQEVGDKQRALLAGHLLGIPFHPKDGGNMFLKMSVNFYQRVTTSQKIVLFIVTAARTNRPVMFHTKKETETLKLSTFHILFGISEKDISALIIENVDSHARLLL
jgi:hypothetical protein